MAPPNCCLKMVFHWHWAVCVANQLPECLVRGDNTLPYQCFPYVDFSVASRHLTCPHCKKKTLGKHCLLYLLSLCVIRSGTLVINIYVHWRTNSEPGNEIFHDLICPLPCTMLQSPFPFSGFSQRPPPSCGLTWGSVWPSPSPWWELHGESSVCSV